MSVCVLCIYFRRKIRYCQHVQWTTICIVCALNFNRVVSTNRFEPLYLLDIAYSREKIYFLCHSSRKWYKTKRNFLRQGCSAGHGQASKLCWSYVCPSAVHQLCHHLCAINVSNTYTILLTSSQLPAIEMSHSVFDLLISWINRCRPFLGQENDSTNTNSPPKRKQHEKKVNKKLRAQQHTTRRWVTGIQKVLGAKMTYHLWKSAYLIQIRRKACIL